MFIFRLSNYSELKIVLLGLLILIVISVIKKWLYT